MPNQSTINDQISDMVNFVNASNIGQSPPHSMGILDTVMAETIGMGMHNAITAQQNGQMIGNASVAATCSKILSVPIAIPPSAGEKPRIPTIPLQPTMETEINKDYEDAKDAIKKLRNLKTESTKNEAKITSDLNDLDNLITEPASSSSSSSSSPSSSSSSSSS